MPYLNKDRRTRKHGADGARVRRVAVGRPTVMAPTEVCGECGIRGGGHQPSCPVLLADVKALQSQQRTMRRSMLDEDCRCSLCVRVDTSRAAG